MRRPRLELRPVDREVLLGQQVPLPRLPHDFLEEPPGDVAVKEPGEGTGVPREVEEPLECHVGPQPLAELALATNREEGDEECRLEQRLGRNRRSPGLAVEIVEARGEIGERPVDDGLDASERVVAGDEHLRVGESGAALSSPCPRIDILPRVGPFLMILSVLALSVKADHPSCHLCRI